VPPLLRSPPCGINSISQDLCHRPSATQHCVAAWRHTNAYSLDAALAEVPGLGHSSNPLPHALARSAIDQEPLHRYGTGGSWVGTRTWLLRHSRSWTCDPWDGGNPFSRGASQKREDSLEELTVSRKGRRKALDLVYRHPAGSAHLPPV